MENKNQPLIEVLQYEIDGMKETIRLSDSVIHAKIIERNKKSILFYASAILDLGGNGTAIICENDTCKNETDHWSNFCNVHFLEAKKNHDLVCNCSEMVDSSEA